MYEVHHRRRHDSRNDRVVIARNLPSLSKAAEAREVSGDLVVDAAGMVVKSQEWLWDWEKADPNCYAQRAIRSG